MVNLLCEYALCQTVKISPIRHSLLADANREIGWHECYAEKQLSSLGVGGL
jgi:hypothetical protein